MKTTDGEVFSKTAMRCISSLSSATAGKAEDKANNDDPIMRLRRVESSTTSKDSARRSGARFEVRVGIQEDASQQQKCMRIASVIATLMVSREVLRQDLFNKPDDWGDNYT